MNIEKKSFNCRVDRSNFLSQIKLLLTEWSKTNYSDNIKKLIWNNSNNYIKIQYLQSLLDKGINAQLFEEIIKKPNSWLKEFVYAYNDEKCQKFFKNLENLKMVINIPDDCLLKDFLSILNSTNDKKIIDEYYKLCMLTA